MNEIGLILAVSGMGSVFVVLSILAFVMWLLGKIFGSKELEKLRPSDFKKFSELEVLAISAAIIQHESIRLPEVKTPENWKRYAKIYASGWSE